MGLSNDLISKFVKITNDNKKESKEGTVYGTAVEYDGDMYVKIDGSDLLTPVNTTADIKDGERVTVTIKNHNATVMGNMTSPSASTSDVKKVTQDVDSMGTQISEFEIVVADKVSVKELDAEVARIDTLIAGKATIEELEVVDAKIENLEAKDAYIENLVADNIKAAYADIEILDAEIADIRTLVNGNLTSDNILSFNITADKVTMDDAFIQDAMIDNVSAEKINSGSINTNLVTIQSEDGTMSINGSTQQFKDDNGNVRIQIGKDASGDFTFILYGADGKGQLINQNGITASAIGNGLIVNDMVSDNAAISGGKLDISSVITEINEDNSTTIKSNKIYLSEQEQSLEVAFNSLKTQVETIQDITVGGDLSSIVEQVQSNTTQINANKEGIDTLVAEDKIIKEQITDLNGDIVKMEETLSAKYATMEQTIDGFKFEVADTYATKTEFDNLKIGARNLLLNTSESKVINGNNTPTQTLPLYIVSDPSKIDGDITISFKYTINSYTRGSFKIQGVSNTNVTITDDPISISGNGTFEYSKHIRINSSEISYYNTGTAGPKVGSAIVGYAILMDGENEELSGGFTAVQIQMNNFVGSITISEMKLEQGNKATTWTPAPEDIETTVDDLSENVTVLETRVYTAESKLTKTSLTTTIGDYYTTSTDVNGILTTKGYATTSQVQQTTDSLTAVFTESGGYNRIRNGEFATGDLSDWNSWGTCEKYVVSSTASGHPYCAIVTTTGGNQGIYQSVGGLTKGKTYTLSCLVYTQSGQGCLMLENPGDNWYGVYGTTNHVYEKLSKTFVASSDNINVYLGRGNGGSSGTYQFTGIMLTEGSVDVLWSPHPNEVYGGVTKINKSGVTVKQSNYNGYTKMSADGFYVNNGTENVISATASGLTVKGKITATSGKIAGFTISGDSLIGNNVGMCGLSGANYAFWAGSNTSSSAPFRVGHGGAVVATDITINGGSINIGGKFKVSTAGALTTDSTIVANGGIYTYQDIRGMNDSAGNGGLTVVSSAGHVAVRTESTSHSVYLQPASGTVYVTQPAQPSTLADLRLRRLYASSVIEFTGSDRVLRVHSDNHLYLQCGVSSGNSGNAEVRCTKSQNVNDYANIRAYNVCAQNAVYAAGVNVSSDRDRKRDIELYSVDALKEVCTTPVYTYHLDTDLDVEVKRIGLIMQEAPLDAIDLSGKGVDLYQMVTMLWRAVQQQQEMIDVLSKQIKGEC